MANPDMSNYTYYFFVSVIQRGTVFVYLSSSTSTLVTPNQNAPPFSSCRIF